jgi:hypothetical protein
MVSKAISSRLAYKGGEKQFKEAHYPLFLWEGLCEDEKEKNLNLILNLLDILAWMGFKNRRI